MKQQGGCQCGAVRYSARIDDFEAYLCHCRMCQRATGNVSIAFKNLANEDVEWLSEPDWYQSSAIARRPFCRKCGTPLGFKYIDGDRIDITIGSFDDPSQFFPTSDFGVESKHSAWEDTSDLPGRRVDESESIVKRWVETVGKLPD